MADQYRGHKDSSGETRRVGKLTVSGDSDERIDSAMDKILGDGDYGAETIVKLVAADEGSNVEITVDKHSGEIEINTTGPTFKSERRLSFDDDGNAYIINDYFKVHESGAGTGTSILSQQVEEAKRLGFSHMECHAARGRNLNGYYTWPRLGYDEPIHNLDSLFDDGANPFPEAESVLDIMSMPGGSEWWKENGWALKNARFDLSDNSRSMQVFGAYLEERSKRASKMIPAVEYRLTRTRGEEIELGQHEEQALDAVWSKIVLHGFASIEGKR